MSELIRSPQGAAFAPLLATVLARLSPARRDGGVPLRVLLVARGSAFHPADPTSALAPHLPGVTLCQWSDYETNPTWTSVQRGVKVLFDVKPDVIVAIGGGSTLDAAKLVAIVSAQPPEARAHLPLKAVVPGTIPLIAAPTTSGSGSEATHFATVYDGDAKWSVEHASMLPSVVMLHAPFVEKMPAALAAETGMDALAHSLESLWSRRATAESMHIAADALRGVRTHLADSVAGDTAARAAMMDAAYFAGRAIALTRTTASHALSYHLSTRFGVRHGHAAGITLPWMIKHTAARAAAREGDDQAPPLKEKIARLINALDVPDAAAAADLVSALMRNVGLSTSLGAFGIGPADAEAWFGSINAERLGNHPCSFSRDDFFSMFAALL